MPVEIVYIVTDDEIRSWLKDNKIGYIADNERLFKELKQRLYSHLDEEYLDRIRKISTEIGTRSHDECDDRLEEICNARD